MKIKLLAIDIDGTLLTSRWELPKENSKALAAAHNLGVEIILVTGRRLHTAELISKKLPFPVTLIASNGAIILTSAGKIPYRNFLPCNSALEVIQETPEKHGYIVALFEKKGKGQLVMEEKILTDGPASAYLTRYPEHLKLVPSLKTALNSNLIQLSFVGPVYQIMPTFEKLIKNPVSKKIHISKTDYSERDLLLVDILNYECNKGSGLAFWATHQNIKPSEIMAIGDNFNDIEMLQFAGRPIAMGNSVQKLREKGWEITKSNNESGVAVAVQKHILK